MYAGLLACVAISIPPTLRVDTAVPFVTQTEFPEMSLA